MYCLNDLNDKGHVFAPSQFLIEQTAENLDVDADLVIKAVTYLKDHGDIVADDDRIYTTELYTTECSVAQHLRILAKTPLHGFSPKLSEIEKIIGLIAKSRGFDLAPTAT